jgi:hypothetical protein
MALHVVDALDQRLISFDRELRAFARSQAGCRALIAELYRVGELTGVTILAELGNARRFANSRDVVRYSGLEMLASNCTSCSGDFGLRDVGGVRDPFAAFLLDGGAERDPQAVGGVAVGGELVV